MVVGESSRVELFRTLDRRGRDREKKKKKKKNFPRRGKYGIVRGMLDVACGSALG